MGDSLVQLGAAPRPRLPAWARKSRTHFESLNRLKTGLRLLNLHTVCESARCPNIHECFHRGAAAFMILGDRCTRGCGFCSVETAAGSLGAPDHGEPARVGEAAARLRLTHVVVTSVTRDDLPDGGAAQFAATIGAVRKRVPGAAVEVLVPDFGGDEEALETVLSERPDVLAHNLETVPRLYASVRPGAGYRRSLELLARVAGWAATADGGSRGASAAGGSRGTSAAGGSCVAGVAGRSPLVKTGLMLGLGETGDEVDAVLRDCVAAGADLVAIGQYLQPDPACLAVARYVPPEEFDALRGRGERLGLHVIAAPFVRSSYRAGEALAAATGDL